MKFNFCKQRVICIMILFNVVDILIKLLWSHVSIPDQDSERFPLPLGAWNGLRNFILALPEPFI